MKTSTKTLLAGAAVAGLLSGTIAMAATSTTDSTGKSLRSGTAAGTLADKKEKGEKNSCAGKNACKGKGGCKTGDAGCKGKNSCKGKGGCATDGSKK